MTAFRDALLALAERFAKALGSFERDHDLGIVWEHDHRRAGVVVGPNALAGFPFAKGEAEHLDRFEAIVMAVENAAEVSALRARAETLTQEDRT